MNFSLVFQNTGDSISFHTLNNELADLLVYYVENLNRLQANKFYSGTGIEIKNQIDRLDATIKHCNTFVFELLDQYIDTYNLDEYLDQKNLNKLHADWVRSHKMLYNIQEKRKKYQSAQAERIHDLYSDDIPCVPIGNLIGKLGVEKVYNDINLIIHNIESLFSQVKFSVGRWIEIANLFPTTLLTNNVSNFRLSFHHLGRTLHDKFINFDHNLEFDDENSFKELLGFIEVRLHPFETFSLSPEYVAWCNKKNKPPSGQFLNIGNIIDLDKNLTKYRKIIFQNSLQNNHFTIELN